MDMDMLHVLHIIATEHNEPEIPPLTTINEFQQRLELYQKNTQNSNLIKLLSHERSLAYFSNPWVYILNHLDDYKLVIIDLTRSLFPRWWLHEYEICYHGKYEIKDINKVLWKIDICYPIILSGDIIKLDKEDFFDVK